MNVRPGQAPDDLVPAVAEPEGEIALRVNGLTIDYGDQPVVRDVTLAVPAREVTAIVGPSGCGKSTFLRAFNRMNELLDEATTQGEILVDGRNIYAPGTDMSQLRQRVGIVFQKSTLFPKSIFENVAYGLRIAGEGNRETISDRVQESLELAGLWDEVKDRLGASAFGLSAGQQQRLCIARALAVRPETLLMDEPCSLLDPIATARVEELISELKRDLTVLMVTHNLQQAARISAYVGFLWEGRMVEYGRTDAVFTNPAHRLTEAFITGRFG